MVGTAHRVVVAATFAFVAVAPAWAQSDARSESHVWFNCHEKDRFVQVSPIFGVPMIFGQEITPAENLYQLHEEPIADRNDGALRVCHIFDFIHDRVITMHSIARWTSAASDAQCARSRNETLEFRLNGKPIARFDAGCESRASIFQLDYFRDTLTVCQRVGERIIRWSPSCEGDIWERRFISPAQLRIGR